MIFKRITVKQFHCNVCGHDWQPRKPGVPLRCGKCKSSYWARVKASAKHEETKEFEEVR